MFTMESKIYLVYESSKGRKDLVTVSTDKNAVINRCSEWYNSYRELEFRYATKWTVYAVADFSYILDVKKLEQVSVITYTPSVSHVSK